MLNDRLEPEQLRRQLQAFADTGWARVITRTYNGLLTEYMSAEWFELLDEIVDQAQALGLKIWLQAGYMPNAIPELPVEHHSLVLVGSRPGESLEGSDVILRETQGLRVVSRRRDNVLDLASPLAVDFYIRRAYQEAYVARYGSQFGKTIEAIWVDEPSLSRGLGPWGPAIVESFERRWGSDPTRQVHLLFERTGPWRRFRLRYWQTVLEVLREGYFRKISDWCTSHDLLFTGHLMGEDTLGVQTSRTVACMPLYGLMGICGIDHLTEDLRWWHGKESASSNQAPRFVMTPVQCASAACQNGQADVLSEMYGVASPGLSFADRKRIGDWFAVLGINLRCLHGSFYSLKGRRKRIYPPSMNVHQPWWQDNEMVAGYFTRLENALTQGTCCIDVLLVHPIETAHCLYQPESDGQGNDELDDLNLEFSRLSEALLRTRRGFHYGDESMLAEMARVVDGKIQVGQMSYRAMCLCGARTLRSSTLDLIEAFLDAGGRVLLAGAPPVYEQAKASQRIEGLVKRLTPVGSDPEAIERVLGPADPDRLAITVDPEAGGDLLLHERILEDATTVAFLFNASSEPCRPVRIDAGKGKVIEEIDLSSGTVLLEPARERCVDFQPWQSRLYWVTPGACAASSAPATSPSVEEIPLDGSWRIEKQTPNALVLDMARLQVGDEPMGPKIPVSAIGQILEEERAGAPYRGPIALEFDVRVDAPVSQVQLVLEEADQWEIRLNGRQVPSEVTGGFWDESFAQVDLADRLREGENLLRISRDFQPLAKTKGLMGLFANLPGTEVEPAALIGSFTVRASQASGPRRDRCRRIASPMPLGAWVEQVDPVDLVSAGYPFFAGRMGLCRRVSLPEDVGGRRVWLNLPDLDACVARVSVNGRRAGRIAWAPRRLEITDLVGPGENRIEIELATSLRNLIGPLHRPQGEPKECWGFAAFFGRFDKQTNTGYPRWWLPENRREDTLAWTDDYFVRNFGLGRGACISIET
jgi:hypothetical protein